MKREELKEILKDYAEELREGTAWLEGAPFSARCRMASGKCIVVDKDNETVAIFVTKVPPEEYNPSCPVSPRDVQASGILAKVLNDLARMQTEKPGD